MIAAIKTELGHEWGVIRPVLVKNIWLKIGTLLVIWIIHSTNNQAGKSNILMNAVYNPNQSRLGSAILATAEWDGLYFLEVSLHGHYNLKQFAFYPGFPAIVKTIYTAISSLPGISFLLAAVPTALTIIFTGFCLNFVLHLINNWLLYQWLRLRGFTQSQAYFSALTFGLGGNALYHLTFYTESSYMFITLFSLYILAKAGNNPGSMPLYQFLGLTVFFACGGFIRSVGLVNGAYLGYPLVLELVYALVRTKKVKRTIELIGRILVVIGCFFTPVLFLFFKSRRLFCHQPTPEDPEYVQPGFCLSPRGFFYGYVQEAYWSVRLFDYFKDLTNLHTWIFAFVTCIVSSIWLKKAYQNAGIKGLITIHIPEFLSHHNLKSPRIVQMPELVIFSMQYIGYYLYAHLGSIERFWSATPAYYMFLISAQQVLVSLSKAKDKTSKPSILARSLKYMIPASLTIRHIAVPVWHSARMYPI
jgi:Mannosyltransferase (PIG-V)